MIYRFNIFLALLLSLTVEVFASASCRVQMQWLVEVSSRYGSFQERSRSLANRTAELYSTGFGSHVLIIPEGVFVIERSVEADSYKVTRVKDPKLAPWTQYLSSISGAIRGITRSYSPEEYRQFLWHLDFKDDRDQFLTRRIPDGPQTLFFDSDKRVRLHTPQSVLSRAIPLFLGLLSLFVPHPISFKSHLSGNEVSAVVKIAELPFEDSWIKLRNEDLYQSLPDLDAVRGNWARASTPTYGMSESRGVKTYRLVDQPEALGLVTKPWTPSRWDFSTYLDEIASAKERLKDPQIAREWFESVLQAKLSKRALWIEPGKPTQEILLPSSAISLIFPNTKNLNAEVGVSRHFILGILNSDEWKSHLESEEWTKQIREQLEEIRKSGFMDRLHRTYP